MPGLIRARLTRSPLLVATLLAASLNGCGAYPGRTTSEPGTPSLVVPATVAASATPFAARFSDLSLIPGEPPGSWVVNGLVTNDSSAAAAGLQLNLSVLDAQGQTLATAQTAPLIDRLGPGETSPFTYAFQSAPGAVRVLPEVAASSRASFERALIDVESLQQDVDSSGGASVTGMLTNKGNRPAAIGQVAVAARASGRLASVGQRQAGMSYVRPGESVPFEAHLSAFDPGAQLSAWVDAIEISTPDPAPTAVTASAGTASTSQGLPFVVGSVHNTDRAPRIASLVVALKAKSRVLGLANVMLPIPLAPGETTIFAAAAFPGLSARMAGSQISLADLKAEVVFDPVASGAATSANSVPLHVSVTGYEAIGSTLFFKGQVLNHRSTPVHSPAVTVAVRSTDGKPVTAGWVTIAPSLPPGETADFSLAVPFPAGVDPAMAEYDLSAAGFLSP